MQLKKEASASLIRLLTLPGRSFFPEILHKRFKLPSELVTEDLSHFFGIGDRAVIRIPAEVDSLPAQPQSAGKFRDGHVFVHQAVLERLQPLSAVVRLCLDISATFCRTSVS